jgi:hypothetical protein
VFVVDGDRLTARPVAAGVSNLDETEIIAGLAAGEQVAVTASAQLLREQAEFRERVQGRMTGMSPFQRSGGQGGGTPGGGPPAGGGGPASGGRGR